MKIYSWNVNGIRAVIKKGAWDDFLDKHDPDILCVQETKATQEQVDMNNSNYEQFWCSAERKGYSGTMIMSKYTPEQVHVGFMPDIKQRYELSDNYGDLTNEGRIITMEFAHTYVCNVYTPNAKDDLSRLSIRESWDKAFLDHIKTLSKTKPVIALGDFNVAHNEIDLARPKENHGKKGFTTEERTGFDNIINSGFIDTFRYLKKDEVKYSWWSQRGGARDRNIGWRIDYVLASDSLSSLVKQVGIHNEVMGSDHCPVSVHIAGLKI